MIRVLAISTALALSALACVDRTREPPDIEFEEEEEEEEPDAGSPDMAAPIEPDGICDGLADGTSCALQNARGICFRQRCRFVACESGFGDCDDETAGCETDLRTTTDCGECGASCEGEERCVESPRGAACAAGIVCPTDRFDLDSDPANGCEWEAVWEDARTLVPGDLAIEASSWDGAPVVAGRSQGSRISTRLAGTPEPTVWEVPTEMDASAVAVRYAEETREVLWTDGLTSEDSAGAQTFAELACVDGATPRRFVGSADEFVATQWEVARVGRPCDDPGCLEPVFGIADYLRAFWPYQTPPDRPDVADPTWQFDADELVDCAADCLLTDTGEFSVPEECAGVRQCRSDAFDAAACGGCSADSGCPEFRVVDVTATSEFIHVVTARGVVVLARDDLRPLARVEDSFDPETSGGPRFVAARATADAEGARVTLLHSTGYARTLRVRPSGDTVTVAPVAADLGTDIDFEQSSLATEEGVLVVVEGQTVRLVSPDRLSGRSAFLTMESAPGIQGLAPVSAVSTPDGVRVLYVAAGQLFTRLIRHTSTE